MRGRLILKSPYKNVSSQPVAKRDISIAIIGSPNIELLGDKIRQLECADVVENVRVVSVTKYGDLPSVARNRLCMKENMCNVLLSLELRSLEKTLTAGEINTIHDIIYDALHQGGKHRIQNRVVSPEQLGR